MPAKQSCAQYKYVLTSTGPKIVAVPDYQSKDEESPADYNAGGYLPIKVKDEFKNGRYTVVRKLGWGHFSTVWLVKDSQENRHSALKVVKSAGRYAETARDEVKLLSKVAEANVLHPGRLHIVSFLDSFDHNGPEDTHVCIVFEPLGENLLSLIERNKKKGVPVALVKTIARQVLLGLEYLHNECDLVHTDIKPENILVAIPEVEYHIHTELSTSPSPTSRRVGVPPPKSRAGVTIPYQRRSTFERERHVQIFDSQPLSSPPSRSGSASNSLNMSTGAASLHAQIQKLVLSSSTKPTINDTKAIEATTLDKNISVIESPNLSPVSIVSTSPSIPAPCSNESTPPTSLGSHGAGAVSSRMTVLSAKEKLKLKAEEYQQREKPVNMKLFPEQIYVSSSKEPNPEVAPVHSSLAGPSLLSQTAPRHRTNLSSSSNSGISSSSQKQTTVSPTPSPISHRTHFEAPISVKIADLGNASPSTKHYTEDIQTRQYRAPEAIIGRKDWGTRADIWSVACVIFELLTAEYLFDPQSQGQLFTKDDDHMAQIIELMGDFALDVKMGGKYSRGLFDHTGALRSIRTLKHWPLKRVMMEKYLYKEKDAVMLCSFLEPMLAVDQRDRKEARDMVSHPWMDLDEDEWMADW